MRGYISRITCDLIEKRQAACEQGRSIEVIDLNRNISVSANKDERNHVLESLKKKRRHKSRNGKEFEATEATYLGHQITHNMKVKHELDC